MERWDCDLLVIGSGFGGAVCAMRAAAAGLRVTILERGQQLTPQGYEAMAEGHAPLFHGDVRTGPLELHRLKGLLALTASAVGGGSNIYTAVTIRPRPEVFDTGWPAGVDIEALAPCYDRVEAMIAPTPVPHPLSRTAALDVIGRRTGAGATRLPLAMNWPADPSTMHEQPRAEGVYRELITWLRGGRTARKRTLDETYLAAARKCGAQVLPLHEVEAIVPEADQYGVRFRRRSDGTWREGLMRSPRVVLAAGTLGTVRLLLGCRDGGTLPRLSPTLGERFFTNGDFGGLLVGPDLDLAADSGPPVTGWLDHWQGARLYAMETGFLPYDFGSFAGLLNPASWCCGLRLKPVSKLSWSFGLMGLDDNPGRLMRGRRGGLVHRRDPEAGRAYHDGAMVVLRQLAEAAGGKLVTPPAVLARRLPITVHPLGGAGMAESPDRGVTDPFGEVFGHPNLYIADGSLMPGPLGAPPSMTIAALAERVIERLISTC